MKRVPKNEYARRLLRVERAIKLYFATGNGSDLHPSLASLYTYMWCKSSDDMTKLVPSDDLPF